MVALGQLRRERLLVKGIVQGVGFRPFVYALARRHGLSGFAGNNSEGVFVEVQGPPEAIEAFCADLVAAPPPLAVIDSIARAAVAVQEPAPFLIVESEAETGRSTPVSPDIAVCGECLRELFDPADRRYRYPFLNCTNCGPRFTIIRDVPYDRAATTMSSFAMCELCRREYEDPRNRRFHAQPIACPQCGPQVWLLEDGVRTAERGEAIERAAALLVEGRIVAVKGIGGFHLACDAANDGALRILRERKGRVDKPFAVMVRDLNTARRLAYVDEDEARLLESRERPIVLVLSRGQGLSPLVAPGNRSLGLFLPYSPLHCLLVRERPLVMTSGNRSDEPIARDNEEALARLDRLADAFLLHNRPIHAVCDDSVVRVFRGAELPVRRSRGYAPFPVKLPFSTEPLLAAGGELKAAFCLARDRWAYVSQHIGDMENLETLEAFETALRHFQSLFRIRPRSIAHDLHPGYLSTQWARRQDIPCAAVQHHHAHIASVMCEHGLDGEQPVIGVSFDGTGYGTDGAIWGGEVLVADYRGFRRAGHLQYVRLPGGDAAIRRPYRAACAHLWAAGLDWEPGACPPQESRILMQQLERNVNCVPTSSMGRLFDAVAVLLGVRQTVTYEAQAAMEMEALCDTHAPGEIPLPIVDGTPFRLDPGPALRQILDQRSRAVPPGVLAMQFHRGVARAILDCCRRVREAEGIAVAALSGGVFQNVLLLRLAEELLRSDGFRVLTHRLVPPNDGGLALGQAVVAAANMR